MLHKSNFFWEHTQGVDPNILEEILKQTYVSIKKGTFEAINQIIKNPDEYDFRNAKPVRISSLIKREFIKTLSLNEQIRKKIGHYKSHGVDYFLIEGKFLICFKKIDKKGRISGFYSERFKAILNGEEKVPYSRDMLEQLANLGLLKPLPILFVGHTLDKSGLILEDVKCVNYKDGDIHFLMSLKDLFTPNLFNQKLPEEKGNKTDTEIWTPKLKGGAESVSN